MVALLRGNDIEIPVVHSNFVTHKSYVVDT